jgi:hypothetical protein
MSASAKKPVTREQWEELSRRYRELSERVDQLSRAIQPDGRWWATQAGRFANDPAFEEIVRLGRKYRLSKRPKLTREKTHRARLIRTS